MGTWIITEALIKLLKQILKSNTWHTQQKVDLSSAYWGIFEEWF